MVGNSLQHIFWFGRQFLHFQRVSLATVGKHASVYPVARSALCFCAASVILSPQLATLNVVIASSWFLAWFCRLSWQDTSVYRVAPLATHATCACQLCLTSVGISPRARVVAMVLRWRFDNVHVRCHRRGGSPPLRAPTYVFGRPTAAPATTPRRNTVAAFQKEKVKINLNSVLGS
jgi:hypothetical protein